MSITIVERAAPQLWFRPNSNVPLRELLRLIEDGIITRTPRLGARDEHHPKGYCIGERARLEVRGPKPTQEAGEDPAHLCFEVEITGLLIVRIDHLTLDDLTPCGPLFRSWVDVQRVLSGFERREVDRSEVVTIVRFKHLAKARPRTADVWTDHSHI